MRGDAKWVGFFDSCISALRQRMLEAVVDEMRIQMKMKPRSGC